MSNNNMTNFPRKIAIIGIGLIGGSIALGLKKHFGQKITILGSCSDRKKAILAKNEGGGMIDIVLDKDKPLAGDVELIILATPVFSILKLLKFLSRNAPVNSLVIDVGSTKKVICEQAKRLLPSTVSFIGTHPMAGGEASGFENASVDLFRNKPWIICPTNKKNRKKDLHAVEKLITILGANSIVMKPVVHDEIVTWASHMSMITANILIGAAARQSNWKTIGKVASTGFYDTTRLASHNPEIKKDIISTNKENVLKALDAVKNEIDDFSDLLRENNEKKVMEYFTKTKQVRDDWVTSYFN